MASAIPAEWDHHAAPMAPVAGAYADSTAYSSAATDARAGIPPMQLVDDQETLLATSDLVFVDAVAPATRKPSPPTPTRNSGPWTARLGESQSIILKYHVSGHMTYLDDTARRAQQLDLINFYNGLTVSP